MTNFNKIIGIDLYLVYSIIRMSGNHEQINTIYFWTYRQKRLLRKYKFVVK